MGMNEEDSAALRILATKMTDRIVGAIGRNCMHDPPRVVVMVELVNFLRQMPQASFEEICYELTGEAAAEKLAGPEWRAKADEM
jgi:hypothetical protein